MEFKSNVEYRGEVIKIVVKKRTRKGRMIVRYGWEIPGMKLDSGLECYMELDNCLSIAKLKIDSALA